MAVAISRGEPLFMKSFEPLLRYNIFVCLTIPPTRHELYICICVYLELRIYGMYICYIWYCRSLGGYVRGRLSQTVDGPPPETPSRTSGVRT